MPKCSQPGLCLQIGSGMLLTLLEDASLRLVLRKTHLRHV